MGDKELLKNILEKSEATLNIGNRTGVPGQSMEIRYYDKKFYGILKEFEETKMFKRMGMYAIPLSLFASIQDKEYFDYDSITKVNYSKDIKKLLYKKKNSLGQSISSIKCHLHHNKQATYIDMEDIKKIHIEDNYIILYLNNGSQMRLSMLNEVVGVRCEKDVLRGNILVFTSKISASNWCVLKLIIR